MYPDQSLYPANSVPTLVRRINQALLRADQIEHAEGKDGRYWFAPIMADAEAGFGGPLNAFELMKGDDRGGRRGRPLRGPARLREEVRAHGRQGARARRSQFIRTLVAARLAADVMGVPTLLVARTDADSAKLLTSDIDQRDKPFIERASARPRASSASRAASTRRSRAASPTRPTPTSSGARPRRRTSTQARSFAEGIHAQFPGKLLAYNCSPSFNWKKHLDDATIAKFQRELGAMGYKFQFVTLAGFHALNHGMFELARDYRDARHGGVLRAPAGASSPREQHGYTRDAPPARGRARATSTRSPRSISGGAASTLALQESTEAAQF